MKCQACERPGDERSRNCRGVGGEEKEGRRARGGGGEDKRRMGRIGGGEGVE